MTHVVFELYQQQNLCTPQLLVNAMQELLYPGMHPDIPSTVLKHAERYFGSSAWYMLYSLGRNHYQPFYFSNGVVLTWSNYTSNQLMSIIRSGNQSAYPLTADA